MNIEGEKFVLGKEGRFVPATPEDLKPEISEIIASSREDFKRKVERHEKEGWTLVERRGDSYARFKNEFPVLTETTVYMRQLKLPDFVEIKLEQ